MKQILLMLAVMFVACSENNVSPVQREFNIDMRYGVSLRNELNTYANTYTKDLIVDGTITVPFMLTDEEIDMIRERVTAIGFMSYPDTLVTPYADSIVVVTSPVMQYNVTVTLLGAKKTVYWKDLPFVQPTPRADSLAALVTLVMTIVESKTEYKRLPPASGGYL